MRRLHVLLMTAGLLAAPASAVAGPSPRIEPPRPDDKQGETFEWSMATSRARLGIMVIGLTSELREHFGAPADRGVLVGRVQPGSAAAEAGLAVGDVLVEVDGDRVESALDVLSTLADRKQGDRVSLSVIRNRKPLTLTARMADDGGRAPTFRWPKWIEEWFESMPDPWAPRRDT